MSSRYSKSRSRDMDRVSESSASSTSTSSKAQSKVMSKTLKKSLKKIRNGISKSSFKQSPPCDLSSSSDNSDVEENSCRSKSKSIKKEKQPVETVDSDSSIGFEPVVPSKKKLKRDISIPIENSFPSGSFSDASYSGKETLPVSPASSSASSGSDETTLPKSREGSRSRTPSPSLNDPDAQWEIEEIRDYIKDGCSDMYYVKWKDWSDHFNTWEPTSNLLNCNREMLRFYKARRKLHRELSQQGKDVEYVTGKKRRRPTLPYVPPDPRPFDDQVQEFFDHTGCPLEDRDIMKVAMQWRAKKLNSKSRWPIHKVSKYLADAVDGLLSEDSILALRKQIILIEVEKRIDDLEKELKEWEISINESTKGKPYISVENDLDFSGPPSKFKFVDDYVAGEGVVIPSDPPVGCQCAKGDPEKTCYDERNNCCAGQFGYKFAYSRYGKVNVMQGSPIYECNSKCKCGPECPNRVVQNGETDHKLCIFRTKNGCGWGVKTLKSIKKGSFVTLYVGEVIKSEEAERRGKIYDRHGVTYLFDLDFNDPETYPYSVDASCYGNVAHFINHSCSPNLAVYAVWVDCLDPNLPKLAMFAQRDIARNEELTFDYNVDFSGTDKNVPNSKEDDVPDKNKTRCLCGTSKCRKYIF